MSSPGGGSLSVGTLTAKLDMDTAAFTRGLAKADAGMKHAAAHGEESGNRMAAAFKKVGMAIGELAVYEFAKEAVTAYAGAETAVTKLNDVISKTKGLTDGSKEGIATFSEEIQKLNEEESKKSRFDVASLNSGAAVLAQFHMTGEQLKANIPILVDYAARTGQTLPVAAAALGKATLGATRPLKALGISFKATHDQAKDMATVFTLVGQKTKGYAETDLGTAAGKMANFKKQLEEINVAIGSALVPVLESVAAPIGVLAGGVQTAAEAFAKLPGPIRDTALALVAIMAIGKIGLFASLTRGSKSMLDSIRLFGMYNSRAEAARVGMSRLGLVAGNVGRSIGTVGKGLMSAFGGGLGLILAGVTIAIGLFSAANARAKQRVEENKQALESFAETLNKTSGALTAASLTKLIEDLDGSDAAYKKVGSSAEEMAKKVAGGQKSFEEAQQELIKFNQAAVDNVNKTGAASIYIEMLGKQFKINAQSIRDAAIIGGDAQVRMADKLVTLGIPLGSANDTMNTYRGSIEHVADGLGDLDTVQSRMITGTKETAESFHKLALGAAEAAGIKMPEEFVKGLEKATTSGKTAEQALTDLGATSKQSASIIAALSTVLVPAGDDAHSFADGTEAGAEGAKKLGDSSASAATQTKLIKDQLDKISTAASDADTSSQLLQATLDRLAGRSQSQTDRLRLQETTLRGITAASRNHAKALLDVADKQQAVTDAEKGVDLHDQEHNTLALAAAEKKLADARKKPIGKHYDDATKVLAVAKATQAVADAQKRVDNPDTVAKANKLTKAKLDLADSQAAAKDTDDAEAKADEDASHAMIDNANAAAVAAKAHGGVAAAADAGAASMTRSRAEFIKNEEAAGKTADAAGKLADKYGLIPSEVRTAIIAIDTATPVISSVHSLLLSLPTELQVAITGEPSGIEAAITRAIDAIQRMRLTPGYGAIGGSASTGYTVPLPNQPKPKPAAPAPARPRGGGPRAQALGGAVTGGTAGKDSVPILGMPGEHMLTTGDVARLGGQAGVYRFRKALEAGKVNKYAAGGAVPSGGSLAGTPAFQPGDREGNVRSALGDLSTSVADFAAAAADARAAAADAKGKLADAKGSQRSTAVEQASKVADVRAKDAAKLLAAEHALTAARAKAGKSASDAAAHNAAAIARAENALTAARARGHKSAAETASRSAAIARAETALSTARARGSGGGNAAVVKAEQHLAAVRAANAVALAHATAAQHRANTAQNAAVRAAQSLATATARTAATDTARAAAEARTQAAEAGMRAQLITLGRQYDANSTKLGNLTSKLDDLQSKSADTTNSISQNVQGIGGGILGSDAFTGNATNPADMIKSLQQNLATAKGFDANIAKLVALGLNPAQAEKVANADPTGRGGVVASSLAGASKAQIAQINTLLAQEAGVGTTTGKRVAGAEYGAQIHTTSVQIAATNLNMKIEAAEAAAIGNTIAKATRAAMVGQRVVITIGAKELNGVIASVVRTEHSAEVRHAAGRR